MTWIVFIVVAETSLCEVKAVAYLGFKRLGTPFENRKMYAKYRLVV